MLYPLPHWRDTAKATRENLAAMRAHRDKQLTEAQHEHHRKSIHEQHSQMERDMMIGYKRMIDLHMEFVQKFPRLKDNRPTFSDPPSSPHKDKISPKYKESPHHHKHLRRLKGEGLRNDQEHNGRKIVFWND